MSPSVQTGSYQYATLSLEPLLDSAAAARRFVRDRLATWDADDLADDALLALSELVTNAIIHAQSSIEVHLRLDDQRLRVEVRDRSARPVLLDSVVAGVADERLDAGSDAVADLTVDEATSTGRGLFIVAAVATAVGEQLDHQGKVVWFEIERSPGGTSTLVVQARALHDGEQLVPIKLLALPTAVVIAADEHLDDLLRELPLASAIGDHEAKALVDCAREVWTHDAEIERIADGARVAASRHRDRVDISLKLTPSASDRLGRLYDLAAAAQELCRRGSVLTLPASDEVLAFWRWLAAEVRRQLVGGEAPTPFD